MQILLAQPSKDTQSQIDFTTSNTTSLVPTTTVSHIWRWQQPQIWFPGFDTYPSSLVTTQQPDWFFLIMSDHVTPLLKTLQWLPIWLKLKSCSDLQGLPAAIPCPPTPCSIFSSSHTDPLVVPWLCQAHSTPRAFAVPSAWHSPPPDIRMICSPPSFTAVQRYLTC